MFVKRKLLLFILLLVATTATKAQDSLFATAYHTRFFLPHLVGAGESLMDVARRYSVTQQVLAGENEIPFPYQIYPGTTLRIPFNPANLLLSPAAGTKPVFFRCEGRENLLMMAGSAGRTFKELRDLNPNLRQYCDEGNSVLLGYLQQDLSKPAEVIPMNDAPRPDTVVRTPVENTPPAPPENTLETEFKTWVDAGAQVLEQKGPVAFFPGGTKGMYYAFHNTASPGNIVRFRNPVNGKTVYAKVLGPLPVIKKYYRAVAAISDNARRALGALGDTRLWCEVAFMGY